MEIHQQFDNNTTFNKYDLSNEYGIGYTTSGESFLFDINDYELIKNYSWRIGYAGYVVTTLNDDHTVLRMHRLILNTDDEDQLIDHINHDKADNRRSNLRIVTNSQNQMNSRNRQNTSGHKGISWHIRKRKWIAYIGYNNRIVYLGIFDDINDAISARKNAEQKYFGEYAYNEDQDTAINIS